MRAEFFEIIGQKSSVAIVDGQLHGGIAQDNNRAGAGLRLHDRDERTVDLDGVGEEIACGVIPSQIRVRHIANEANTAPKLQFGNFLLDRRPTGSVAHDHKMNIRGQRSQSVENVDDHMGLVAPSPGARGTLLLLQAGRAANDGRIGGAFIF